MHAEPSTNGVNGSAVNRLEEVFASGPETPAAANASPSPNGDNGYSGRGRKSKRPGTPSTNGSNGRDACGRFLPGNPGGPGNPFARRVAAFRQAVLSALSEEDLRALARCLLAQALAGDVAAAQLLLVYAVGRPVEAVDPDTLDHKELQLYQSAPAGVEDLTEVMNRLPAALALALVRSVLPVVGAEKLRGLAEGLKQ
jgi:hypothetical protein